MSKKYIFKALNLFYTIFTCFYQVKHFLKGQGICRPLLTTAFKLRTCHKSIIFQFLASPHLSRFNQTLNEIDDRKCILIGPEKNFRPLFRKYNPEVAHLCLFDSSAFGEGINIPKNVPYKIIIWERDSFFNHLYLKNAIHDT